MTLRCKYGIKQGILKLVVSKNGEDYSDDVIRALTEFQERFFDSIIIINK